jgi:cell wall-associated NlpC family hydrolase
MTDPLLHMKALRAVMKRTGARDEDIYRDLLACFNGTPYVRGGSTPDGCDCSGSVCTTLNILYSRNIDATADTLCKRYFTESDDRDTALCAVFFLNREGRAVHVAGRLGDDFYMNVSRAETAHAGTIRSYDELAALYPQFRMIFRSLRKGAWR